MVSYHITNTHEGCALQLSCVWCMFPLKDRQSYWEQAEKCKHVIVRETLKTFWVSHLRNNQQRCPFWIIYSRLHANTLLFPVKGSHATSEKILFLNAPHSPSWKRCWTMTSTEIRRVKAQFYNFSHLQYKNSTKN